MKLRWFFVYIFSISENVLEFFYVNFVYLSYESCIVFWWFLLAILLKNFKVTWNVFRFVGKMKLRWIFVYDSSASEKGLEISYSIEVHMVKNNTNRAKLLQG